MVVTSNRNRLRSTLGSVQSTSDDKSQQLKPSTGLKAESESMQRQAVRDRIDSDWGKAVRERNLHKLFLQVRAIPSPVLAAES